MGRSPTRYRTPNNYIHQRSSLSSKRSHQCYPLQPTAYQQQTPYHPYTPTDDSSLYTYDQSLSQSLWCNNTLTAGQLKRSPIHSNSDCLTPYTGVNTTKVTAIHSGQYKARKLDFSMYTTSTQATVKRCRGPTVAAKPLKEKKIFNKVGNFMKHIRDVGKEKVDGAKKLAGRLEDAGKQKLLGGAKKLADRLNEVVEQHQKHTNEESGDGNENSGTDTIDGGEQRQPDCIFTEKSDFSRMTLLKWTDDTGEHSLQLIEILGTKWTQFGYLIGIDHYSIQNIETTHQKDPIRCITNILNQWLAKGSVRYPPRWSIMCQLLKDLEFGQAELELRRALLVQYKRTE